MGKQHGKMTLRMRSIAADVDAAVEADLLRTVEMVPRRVSRWLFLVVSRWCYWDRERLILSFELRRARAISDRY